MGGVLKGDGFSLVAPFTILAVTGLLFLIALRRFRENRGAHAAEADSPESVTGRIKMYHQGRFKLYHPAGWFFDTV